MCKPFVPPDDLWGIPSREVMHPFEFVGILQVETKGEEVRLYLEELDIAASRRFVDGNWEPLQTGEFGIPFP